MIMDMDKLMATQPTTLLGKWLTDARAWGADADEKDALERNARALLTLWGPRGEIADYASRQWSGLLAGYYYARWQARRPPAPRQTCGAGGGRVTRCGGWGRSCSSST